MKALKRIHTQICGLVVILSVMIVLNSCRDDVGGSEVPLSGKAIGFSVSYTEDSPKATRTASKLDMPTHSYQSEDGELKLDVIIEDDIDIPDFHCYKTRGTQINSVGEWSYRVRAYYDRQDGSKIQDYFSNHPNGIEIESDNGTFTTEYPWPIGGDMRFFAFAPTTAGVSVDDNCNTLTYTIPTTVTEQQDVMVAQKTVVCPSPAAVDLQFKHMLAAVQFKVGKMQFIKINSLTISGVKGGTITMNYDSGNDSWSYSASNNNVSYSPIFTTGDNPNFDTSGLLEGTYIAGNDNDLTMFVMPQTLKDIDFIFNYTQLIDGQTFSKSVSLSEEDKWAAGQTYNYVVNIGTNIIQIEIPTPPDADAHYVRVDMTYDVSKLKNVKNIKARAYWENDESNTASDAKQDIKLKTSLTTMQKKGYFTDELWKLEYEIKKDGTTNPSNPVPQKAESIIGSDELSISTGSKGNIYLFIEENDGLTNRNGILEFTATSTKTNNTFTIGKGRFKQLCPSWNNDNIGVERFEDADSYPWGYNYNRKVSYTSNITPDNLTGLLGFFYKIILLLTGGTTQEVIPDGTVAADGFITTKTTDVFGNEVIWYVELDYSALNKVIEEANSEDGLANTKALYRFTGNTDISDLENQLDNNISDWSKKVEGDTEIPDDYATIMALRRNRMREVHVKISSSEGTQEFDKVLLHKVAEGNGIAVNGTVDETGDDIVEWYLPSYVEAQSLVEIGTGTESTPISKLDGTYWSSNAGSDKDAQAYSFSFSNNRFMNYTATDGRLEKRKIRAVRKKSN